MSTKRKTPHGWRVDSRIRLFKTRATKRGDEWTLTFDQARTILTSPCTECGIKPDWTEGEWPFDKPKPKQIQRPKQPMSLGRRDYSKGYTLENCVSYCPTCNASYSKVNRPSNNPNAGNWRKTEQQREESCIIHKMMHPKNKNRMHTPAGWRVEKKFYQIADFCKKIGREFSLTNEEGRTLLIGPCHYCGVEPKLPFPGGIDRLDPAFGYITGNCVSSCWPCNRAKHSLSEKEYLSQVFRTALKHFNELEAVDATLAIKFRAMLLNNLVN